ncbi:MAG: GGDEF domain-containing protein, partial [Pseudomonadales bacterium]
LQDLASMAERELAAVQLATLDELTGVSNRRGFMMLGQHSLNLCIRQALPASLVFIDLNKFKAVNDEFGHAEGDSVLIAFADQIKSVFRDSDLFARLGGDEFVVLLTNASKDLTADIMARFQQSLDKYNMEANRGYDIAFSYGVVEFSPDKHATVEALLAEGDSLMYEHKKAGR